MDVESGGRGTRPPSREISGGRPHITTKQGGGWWLDLGVSKRSIVELRGKKQQIALAEHSRLVVLFVVLGQYLTQL